MNSHLYKAAALETTMMCQTVSSLMSQNKEKIHFCIYLINWPVLGESRISEAHS